jgi:hypothetical protein
VREGVDDIIIWNKLVADAVTVDDMREIQLMCSSM